MELPSEEVLNVVKHVLAGQPGTADLEPQLVEIIEGMLPCLTVDEHLENTEFLLEALHAPLEGTLLDGQARNLSMKFSRALSLIAQGKSLDNGKKASDDKAAKIKAKKERRLKKKNVKVKNKKSTETSGSVNENGIPMWLTREAQEKKTRLRDVNIPIRMSNLGGGTELITKADLILSHGRKYGLIGKNGIGKSTLLSHISNYMFPDFPKYLHVLHVHQEIQGDDTKVIDFVVRSDQERTMLLKQQAELEARRETEDDFEDDHLIDEVYSRLKAIESWAAPARAAEILSGLGFSEERQQAPTKSLSGGWRMRVALACALFVTPDILLLDEPTNHLDFPTVMWLTNYLQSYEKTLVVVSHDRHFLNNVIDVVIEFDQKTLTYYKGDYSTYEKVRAEQLRCAWKAYNNQQEKIAHATEFINKFRANKKLSSMVQSRIKELNKMEKLEKPPKDHKFRFNFPDPEPLRKELLLDISGVSFGYDRDKPPLFKNVDVTVHLDSRIGILGANGAGKSTLISLMQEKFEPWTGTVARNGQAVIGYFAQHHMDVLDGDLTPFEFIQSKYGAAQDRVYQQCSGFGLRGKVVHQKIRDLSGGQKARVSFASLTFHRPHLIIMDEPTNHCDMDTIDGLIEAVQNFKGAVVVVSHDQHFLSHVCQEFWAVGKARVRAFYEFEEAANYSYSMGTFA